MKTLRMILVFLALATAVCFGQTSIETYKTEIRKQDGQRLELDNGASVRITFGHLQEIRGVKPECLLMRDGIRWKIWVEDEGIFECDVETDPRASAWYGEEKRLQEIRSDGQVLAMTDGTSYELLGMDSQEVGQWQPDARLLVLRDQEVLNLDDPGRLIRVRKGP